METTERLTTDVCRSKQDHLEQSSPMSPNDEDLLQEHDAKSCSLETRVSVKIAISDQTQGESSAKMVDADMWRAIH